MYIAPICRISCKKGKCEGEQDWMQVFRRLHCSGLRGARSPINKASINPDRHWLRLIASQRGGKLLFIARSSDWSRGKPNRRTERMRQDHKSRFRARFHSLAVLHRARDYLRSEQPYFRTGDPSNPHASLERIVN